MLACTGAPLLKSHRCATQELKYLSGIRRADLRRRFAGKPWIDVFSKADLLEEEFDAADDLLAAGLDDAASAVAGSQPVGSSRHDNSHDTREASSYPASHLGTDSAQPASPPEDVMRVDSRDDAAESASHVSSGPVRPLPQASTAEDVAAALPHAVRASSVTGAGLDPLKVTSWQGLFSRAYP